MIAFRGGKKRAVQDQKARATAIVEFAVVLPLLCVVLFGIIEYGWVFMVRQTMQNAAREGCRIAVLKTTDEPYTEVTQRVAEAMAATGLTNYTTQMTHADLEAGECEESVSVSVPFDSVSIVGFFPTKSGNLTASCTMRKEGCE